MRNVSQIIQHPGYLGGYYGYIHDITLLIVSRPFTFNEYVKPACLPGSETYNCELKHETKCIITGWGDTRRDTSYDLTLQHATVPIVQRDECRVFENIIHHLRGLLLYTNFFLFYNNFYTTFYTTFLH